MNRRESFDDLQLFSTPGANRRTPFRDDLKRACGDMLCGKLYGNIRI